MLGFLKALSDANRLRLLGILSRGEFTVQEITAILAMGQSRVSHHLKILFREGLIQGKREGTWRYYHCEPRGKPLDRFWDLVEDALKEIPQHRKDLERLGATLELRRKKSREFFDLHSGRWDELSRELLPVADYQAEMLEMIPGSEVLLEVGIGTGTLLGMLSEKAKLVIGIDHSPPMLEEARRKSASSALRNIDLRLGDMSRLPVADGAADTALLNMVLHHAPDPIEVFVELRRVLKPGGMLILADLLSHDRDWVREGLADQWLGFEKDQIENWLTGAGFSKIRLREIKGERGHLGVFLLLAEKPGSVD